jgi:hypothetical protein
MVAYATRDDINKIFGATNVNAWADLDNEEDVSHIEERIEWALELAYTRVNSRLRRGPYAIPFQCLGSGSDIGSSSEGQVPDDIVDLNARLAGILLYDGRRITDEEDTSGDDVGVHRRDVDMAIRGLIADQIKIDCIRRTKDFPRAIPVT